MITYDYYLYYFPLFIDKSMDGGVLVLIDITHHSVFTNFLALYL